VNNLLKQVNEQNFKDLVTSDKIGNRSLDELKAIQNASFEELICSSQEYKKVAQNLLDVMSFNEKTANEIMQKKDQLEYQKQSLDNVAQSIQAMMKEYNDKLAICNKFKDAFSK